MGGGAGGWVCGGPGGGGWAGGESDEDEVMF